MSRKGTFVHSWWECKLVQPLWKIVWKLLKKLKIELPYDPAIPLLVYICIYVKKNEDTKSKRYMHLNVYSHIFTIAKTWKQTKCSSTDEWIKKMWSISTMEYYSAIKKNEILPFVATWMDLEGIMLNVISQTEKDKYCMIPLMCGI